MKKYQSFFLSENFQFLELEFSIYLNRRVFVMSERIPPVMSILHPNVFGVTIQFTFRKTINLL